MPIRTDPWPTGTPCWVDLAVPDVAAATDFYAAVLGWTYSDAGEEYGHYQMCQRDGRSAAGIGPSQQEGHPPVWTTYLASDAVDTTAKLITENGGTLLAEGDPLGGMGVLENAPAGAPPHWMAYFMVDDADVAVAAATERGATVLGGPFDTPYGRMAMITDPQGATFAIMGVLPAG